MTEKQAGLKFEERIPPNVLSLVPEETAKHYKMIPLALYEKVLDVGMVNPDDVRAQEALNFLVGRLGLISRIFKIEESDWRGLMTQYRGLHGEVRAALEELEKELEREKVFVVQPSKSVTKKPTEAEAPIIRMVDAILRHAVGGRASDVHIEPGMDKLRVRLRTDGLLATAVVLPKEISPAVIARVKIMSSLRIDETRIPQDGRFRIVLDKTDVDFRVGIFPTASGEKAALRILDPTAGIKTMPDLGIVGHNFEIISREIRKPFGMILMTGPTGSGKSTTIYAILQILNTEAVNIVSLEDPVEYYIEGVNQSQIRPEIGYSFGTGLRQILRQDPDIIMVGEIRDSETAALAVHSALTGHIVLSTLHTNNAIGVIPRLIDMGVEPFLIPSSLNVAVAQRLIKRLCPDCKRETVASDRARKIIMDAIASMPEDTRAKVKVKEPIKIYQPQGCPQCGGKGTKGRIGMFEVLEMTPQLEEIVITSPTENKIIAEAKRQNMVTMFQDGILKVLDGIISLEELIQVINVEDTD